MYSQVREASILIKATYLKNSGFTLVELLVVVVIIGLLAAIALPNFIATRVKARNTQLKGNMRILQLAAESFATDNGGLYTKTVSSIAPYLPGGSSQTGGNNGNYPTNPATGVTNETPGSFQGNATTWLSYKTSKANTMTGFSTGMVYYGGDNAGTFYVVGGGDCDGSGGLVSGMGGNAFILTNMGN